MSARSKKWYYAHLEHARGLARGYWNKLSPEKREDRLAKKRAYDRHRRKFDGESIRIADRERSRTAWRKISYTRKGAASRGLSYKLPDELAIDLMTDNCFYCGSAGEPLNGIDRVDNQRGYEEDNVVSCCFQCNRAKHKTTREFFEAWILKAAKHLTAYQKASTLAMSA